MKILRVAVALLTLFAGPAVVRAQDMTTLPSAGVLDYVDEVRIGGHVHAVYWTMFPQSFDQWTWRAPSDISFDVLFRTPDMDAFAWLGSPRPEVGVTFSTTYETLAHFGLTWQLPVFDTPVYLEGTFGGAIHNGYLTNPPPGWSALGCRVNFYERFGIGANVSQNMTATLTYEHTSNAGLCDANGGLSNVGIRLGWKF